MGILESIYTVDSNYLTPNVYSQHFCTSFYIELYEYDLGGWEIKYITTLKGDWIKGSVDRDRSSEYMGSCSLELALYDDCIFDCDENFLWENKIIKIIKTYNFLNDKDKNSHDKLFSDSPHIHDTTDYDITMSLGYYVVDSTTCTYDQNTRTLSITGTDVMSVYGEEHGSNLADFITNQVGGMPMPTYINDLLIPAKDENGFMNTIDAVAQTLLEYCSPIKLDNMYIAMEDQFVDNNNNNLGKPDENGTVSLMASERYVPYDLEFSDEIFLYEPLKKLKDLYDDRIMYMSVKRMKFFMRKMTRSWADFLYSNWVFGRQLTNLVISENTTIDKSGIYNYYEVFGKDIDNASQPHAIYELNESYHPFSTSSIGIRKKTIQNDGCMTNDDCYYTGRWSCVKNNEFKEKTTVVICDNYVSPIFQRDGLENLNVGSVMEYTSIHTGETNLYMLNKLSHSFTDGTWTLELQPFRPVRNTGMNYVDGIDMPGNGKSWVLRSPKIEYTIEKNGKVRFIVNNGVSTPYSLFKFFIDDKFIGETCTEDENGNKIFEYQFTENGTYKLSVSAYSSFYEPSSRVKVTIKINNIDRAILTDMEFKIIDNKFMIPKISKLTDEENNLLTE